MRRSIIKRSFSPFLGEFVRCLVSGNLHLSPVTARFGYQVAFRSVPTYSFGTSGLKSAM